MTGPPGYPSFVIFRVWCFYNFLPLVLLCFFVFVPWFLLGPCFSASLFLQFVDIIKAYIYVL